MRVNLEDMTVGKVFKIPGEEDIIDLGLDTESGDVWILSKKSLFKLFYNTMNASIIVIINFRFYKLPQGKQ